MSNLIVEVSTITDIQNHTNSDNLSIGLIRGWQVVIKRGQQSKVKNHPIIDKR